LQVGNGVQSSSLGYDSVVDNATLVFDQTGTTAVFSNISGTGNVQYTGSGTTAYSGTVTYTGTTSVSGGTLTVNGSLASSQNVVGGGGVLAGSGTFGNVTVNSTGTFTDSGTAGSVTVNSGGLVNGSGKTGAVTVNSGGYLGGTLSSGVVVANAGGTVMAGDAPASNSMTSLALSGSATYSEEIVAPGPSSYTGPGNHPVAGTNYGQTTLTGSGNGQTALTLDSVNSILQLSVTGLLPAGGVASNANPYKVGGGNTSLDNYFVLHLSNSTDTVSGEFAQVTLNGTTFVAINYSNTNLVDSSSVGTFTLNGQEWAISYTGNEAANSTIGGDDVVLTAIPEPSAYALFALGGIGLVVFARRRRASL
jgi:hypothetical protein